SDILASPFGYQLHQAYRRFPRPSSAPITKASTVRPCKLPQPPPTRVAARQAQHEHHTTNHNTTCHELDDAVTQLSRSNATHHPHGPCVTLDTIYKKMLASTIQLQSTTPRHHQHHDHPTMAR